MNLWRTRTSSTHQEFGRKFFEVAVTPDRVAAALADIAGSEFAMEPIAQGPGGIAKVSAKVKIQEPRVTRKLGDLITFVIHIPLSIDLLLDLRLDKQRFAVAGDIALRATARAAEPLLIIVDVSKPRPSDITVNVSSKSIRGEILRILAGVDGEIRRFIAQYVKDEIDSTCVAGGSDHRHSHPGGPRLAGRLANSSAAQRTPRTAVPPDPDTAPPAKLR